MNIWGLKNKRHRGMSVTNQYQTKNKGVTVASREGDTPDQAVQWLIP
jgi:hypothetical protein